MKTFKTPKGTELPLLNLRGKDYLQVAHRIVWFREEMPKGRIVPKWIKVEEDYAICSATVYDEDDRELASCTKREDRKHFADFMEKAETGAAGRALAWCGFGTQFAPELDEGERLADSPLPRVGQTQELQEFSPPFGANPLSYVAKFGKFKGKDILTVDREELISYCRYLKGQGDLNDAAKELLNAAAKVVSS